MSPPVKRPATYADIEALPEHLVGEIIDGELIVSPRPAPPYAQAQSALQVLIGGPFHLGAGGPGGWWIIIEPELHLGRQVLVPDLAGWRRERMPALPETAFFELAPDWVCEVVSPSTERIDRSRKLRGYAGHAVQHAWLLNPIARTLEVLQLHEGKWLLAATHADDELVRAAPFEEIEIDLLPLWGEQRKPQPADR